MKLKKPKILPQYNNTCNLFYKGKRVYMIMKEDSELIYLRHIESLNSLLTQKVVRRIAHSVNNTLLVLRMYPTSRGDFTVGYQDNRWSAKAFEQNFSDLFTASIDPFDGDPYEMPTDEV